MVRQFEAAVAIADGHGLLPLHCACSSIQKYFNKKHTAATAIDDADDMDMVEMEMTVQNSCTVMEYLLRVFPAAAAIVDHQGCLPLHHLALSAAAASSVVTYSRTNNNSNNNKMSTAMLRIAQLLVQENAGSLEHRNHGGHCPWLLAAMSLATTTTTESGNNSSSAPTNTTKVTEEPVTEGTAADPCLDVLFYLAQQSPQSILPLTRSGSVKST
jgi:hypothetical protein